MTVSSFLKVLRDLGVFNIYKDNNDEEIKVIQTSIINKSHTDYEYTLDTCRTFKKKLFTEKDAQMLFFQICFKKNFSEDENFFLKNKNNEIYNKLTFEQFYEVIQAISYFIYPKKKKEMLLNNLKILILKFKIIKMK